MEKISRGFAIGITAICIAGLLTISGIISSLGIRNVLGTNNIVTQHFLKNLSLDLGFLKPLAIKYGGYNDTLGKYEYYAGHIKNVIEDLCTVCIPHFSISKEIVGEYKDIIGIKSEVLKQYDEEKSDVVEMALDSVEKFAAFCDENDIDFVYMQMPSKVRYHMVTKSMASYKGELTKRDVEHADMLVERLRGDEINVFSVNDHIDLISQLQFDYRVHSSCCDALEATSLLAEWLAEAGIIDDMPYGEIEYYDILEPYSEAELGYTYQLPVPVDSNHYSSVIDENIYNDGLFNDVFLRNPDTWGNEENIKEAYHKLLVQTNFNLTQVKRKSESSRKKILLLGDSYSWPVLGYLSQYVGQIDSFNPRYFGGNTRKYILTNKPDVIILAFFDGQINEDIAYETYPRLNE